MSRTKLITVIAAALVLWVTYVPCVCADSIIINEFMYDPVGGTSSGQWIELYNTTGASINTSLTPLTIEISGSSSFSGGAALSFTINDKIIGANEFFLISNVNDLGGGVFSDVLINQTSIINTPGGVFSARGIRIKLGANIEDAVLFGKEDGSSTNMASLDPTDYWVGTNPVDAPIVAGTPEGFSIGRVSFIDSDQVSDWQIFSNPTPTSSPLAVPEPGAIFVFLVGMGYFRYILRKK